jgi:PPOX class probable F420-dependent enzyme
MDEAQLRRRVAEARVARIGTVDEQGRAHLVPIVFVLDGDRLYSATDDEPRPAKRLRNLARDPRATVLVDAYDEDWSTVWWVRLRGRGRAVTDPEERARARRLLWDKYPQFGDAPPEEAASPPMMAVDIEQWAGWAYSQ